MADNLSPSLLETFEMSERHSAVELLLDVDYQRFTVDGESYAEIVLYTRNGKRNRNRYYIRNLLPYLYVDTDEAKLMEIKNINPTFDNWFLYSEQVTKRLYKGGKEKKFLKIYGKQPWLVPTIREQLNFHGIIYHEADIPFTHRFMIDHSLKGLTGLRMGGSNFISVNCDFIPRICGLDIEIDSDMDDSSASFERIIKEGDRRITAIAYAWNVGETIQTKVFMLEMDTDQSEREYLQRALDFLMRDIDPDAIVTYNGDKFDLPYIIKRLDLLGIPLSTLSPFGDHEPVSPRFGNGWEIPGLLVYDLYKRTKWMYTHDGRKSLDSVAYELLNETKIDIELSHGGLWRAALEDENQKKLFLDYVERDALLTHKLWYAMHMPEWLEVIKICGAPPGDAMYFTERQAGEFLVFQTMYENNILIPPAPTTEVRKERKRDRRSAQGGLVLDPSKDLATSVLICDFTSMYPSIIASHNIGGESFTGMQGNPRDRFRAEPKTSMAIMQEQMLEKRVEVKEQLKDENLGSEERKKLKAYNWALKIVANSTFGAYNYIGSRFYDTDLASTITGIGRNYLKELSKKVTEFGESYETIYGDTDSVFIETPLDEKIALLWKMPREEAILYEKYVPEIPALLDFLATLLPSQMRLELQDIAYRIIFHIGAKKRYAYVSAIDKNISILGFEAIRHDWSPFAKAVQRRAFDLILTSGDLASTKQEIIDFIQDQLELDPEKLKANFITFGPLRRDPSKYKSTTPAVAAFLDYVEQTGVEASEWKNIDYFPYLIIKGRGAQKDRARHPDFVDLDEIDIKLYIEEALRTVNRFNLDISVDDALGVKYQDLTTFFNH